MWSPIASLEEPPDPRVALWLRLVELVLTALLLAVTLWTVADGAV